jgi:aspartyl-tRNA synthetase
MPIDQAMRLLRRTRRCGEVSESDAERGEEIVLTGWVHRRRDLGQLIFIELRDTSGLVQIVFDPSSSPEAHALAETLRQEYVVGIRGKVVRREAPNPEHPTGAVEVRAEEIVLHNRAEGVPFPVSDTTEAHEEARLTHRYVDLRRPVMQQTLRTRHRLAGAARRVLDAEGFVEVETPILTRSTPEGARDYLVPSRNHPGSFYALPQSPQLFKQLLMVAGFDRYYQFARCFRDEDLRADRQPEFTQIDLEMSFVTPEEVYAAVEPVIVAMFEAIGVSVSRPFRRMPYTEAMDRFGTDRPDTRFRLELRDAGAPTQGTGFKVFDAALEAGGGVRGIVVPGAATATRKQIDRWTEWARDAGARGLVWIKVDAEGGVTSSALKVLGRERCRRIVDELGGAEGDLALLVADSKETCNRVLGHLRLRLADELSLVEGDAWHLLWIEEFPLLEWDAGDKRWLAIHHPFTAPRWDEVELLETQPGEVRSQAYDLVLNGTEIAGGSIRIHRRDVQSQVFKVLGIGDEEARAKFGFLLQALRVGAPPHGGIAFGFDRICAMLGGTESIRDVIAFPKTTSASCLMTGSPAPVDARQLGELHLKSAKPRKGESNQ